MKALAEAIKKVMEEVNWVAKNMTVWTWWSSYKWVWDADVKQVVRESMIKNWLSILPTWVSSKIQIDRWEEDDTYNKQPPYPKKTKQSIFTEVETKYILLHTSWETIELAWYGHWVDTQDKGAWKATTYALKNTLLNMFLVPTWVDTDNTHSDDLPVPPKKAYTPKTSEPSSKKKYFNFPDMQACIDAWCVTWEDFRRVIEQDWYTVSKYPAKAIEEYLKTWNVTKDMFFESYWEGL
jgi:hypothetical protein